MNHNDYILKLLFALNEHIMEMRVSISKQNVEIGVSLMEHITEMRKSMILMQEDIAEIKKCRNDFTNTVVEKEISKKD